MIARSLFLESKKLRVFDFDDTLVFTNSFIYVKKSNGKSKTYTGEYAVYREKLVKNMTLETFILYKNQKS